MRKIINTVFFFIISFQLFSQKTVDSINKYLYTDLIKAEFFSREFYTESYNDKNAPNQIQACYYLGYIKRQLNDIDSTLYFYNRGEKLAKSNNLDNLLLNIKVNKAILFYNNYYYKDALSLYQESLVLAQKLNDSKTTNSINVFIALIKQGTGKSAEALAIFKESYLHEKDNKEQALLEFYLAESFNQLRKVDSASKYIELGLQKSINSKDVELEIHFINLKGKNRFDQNDFNTAERLYNIALTKAKDISSELLEASILLNIAKLKQQEGSITVSNTIVKSLLENINKHSPEELAGYYKLFAENYKKLDSTELSNFYYEKYISKNNDINNKKFKTVENLHKIDIAKINIEKEAEKQQKIYLVIIVLSLCLSLITFLIRSKKQKKKEHLRFESLMLKINDYEVNQKREESLSQVTQQNAVVHETLVIEKQSSSNETKPTTAIVEDKPLIEDQEKKTDTFEIKNEKVAEILDKLNKLEEKHYFLKQECTLHNVAKKLKTNTAYLSRIINNELNKSFSTYINELRINYAILELKNNSRMRAYSTKAIAEEMGYKSSDSFTRYFKAATGITPTVYIKKVNNL
jgi:AraC-like DNA-binding protein